MTLSMSVTLVTCVYLKGRVRNTRNRVQPCLPDKMVFSVCFHRHTQWLRCFWIQSCSYTAPLEKSVPFFCFFPSSQLLWAAGFAKKTTKKIMVNCIVDEGTHWQPPHCTYSTPLLIHCFLMVLHFFVSASVRFALCCLSACSGVSREMDH